MDSHAETQGGVRVHSWMADPKMPGNRMNMKNTKIQRKGIFPDMPERTEIKVDNDYTYI